MEQELAAANRSPGSGHEGPVAPTAEPPGG